MCTQVSSDTHVVLQCVSAPSDTLIAVVSSADTNKDIGLGISKVGHWGD